MIRSLFVSASVLVSCLGAGASFADGLDGELVSTRLLALDESQCPFSGANQRVQNLEAGGLLQRVFVTIAGAGLDFFGRRLREGESADNRTTMVSAQTHIDYYELVSGDGRLAASLPGCLVFVAEAQGTPPNAESVATMVSSILQYEPDPTQLSDAAGSGFDVLDNRASSDGSNARAVRDAGVVARLTESGIRRRPLFYLELVPDVRSDGVAFRPVAVFYDPRSAEANRRSRSRSQRTTAPKTMTVGIALSAVNREGVRADYATNPAVLAFRSGPGMALGPTDLGGVTTPMFSHPSIPAGISDFIANIHSCALANADDFEPTGWEVARANGVNTADATSVDTDRCRILRLAINDAQSSTATDASQAETGALSSTITVRISLSEVRDVNGFNQALGQLLESAENRTQLVTGAEQLLFPNRTLEDQTNSTNRLNYCRALIALSQARRDLSYAREAGDLGAIEASELRVLEQINAVELAGIAYGLSASQAVSQQTCPV